MKAACFPSLRLTLTAAAIFIGLVVQAQCDVDAGADTMFCQQQGQLFATPDAPGNYTFSWSPATGLDNANTQNPNVIAGVHNQQYVVTMTDIVNSCTVTDTVIVSAYYFSGGDTTFICQNSPVVLDFGPGASSYFWQFYTDTSGNTTNLNNTTQTLTVTQPGTYSGIAFFTGCGALTNVFRVVENCFSCGVNAGPDTMFCQQQGQLFATPASAGNYTFSWSPATGLDDTTAQNPNVISGVHNQQYVVTMTDAANNCTATDTVIVSAYYFTAGDTTFICQNSPVTLDFGPGASSYFWQFYTDTAGNTTMLNYTTQTLTVTQPGTYMGYAMFPGCGALTNLFQVVENCNSCTVSAGPDTTFCQLQGRLTATPGMPGNYTYSWSPANGLDDPNTQNPNIIYGVHNQQYVVTMTDTANNCVAYDTVVVSAYYFHIDTVYLCNGNSVIYDLGPGGSNYQIQYTDTLGNFHSTMQQTSQFVISQPVNYLCIAFYPGCGALTSVITAIDSCNIPVGNVWPGDCNYDLVVNMADALHIGLGYGATDAIRPNASNLWYAQPMVDWNQNYTNCNYKHGDADGNGVIDVNDTVPIALNYTLTHPFRFQAPQIPAAAPVLELYCAVDTVGLQTLVQVDVLLGTATLPVDSLYGISFRITSDAGLIDTTLTVINANNSWLGTPGTDMFTFQKHFLNAAVVDFAEVRDDHTNRINGSGPIASYFIVTTDNLSGIAICHFTISEVTAVTESEMYMQFNIVNDSVVIDPTVPAGVAAVDQPIQFNMYPNPANEQVSIQTGGTAQEIEICDMTGRVVQVIRPTGNTTVIQTENLAAGMYLVRVKNGATVSTQKLTISR